METLALITGASRGFGYAVARALAKPDTHILALARTTGGLEELDTEIKARGGSATLVPLDITDEGGLQRLGRLSMTDGANWISLCTQPPTPHHFRRSGILRRKTSTAHGP